MKTHRKAVVAVLLAREHLPFIRDWCERHVAQGFEVYLYDNTGSQASANSNSVFYSGRLQREHRDKRNCHYGAYSAHLTDDQCSQIMADAVNGLPVTIIPWRPVGLNGLILHGQAEAYVDFIRRYRGEIEWAVFIDADEYLFTASGWTWDELIDHCEANGCNHVELTALRYEHRWTQDGKPKELGLLKFCYPQIGGVKNFLRLDTVTVMDTHQGANTGHKCSAVGSVDVHQFGFRHYAEKDTRLKMKVRPGSPSTSNALKI